MTATPTPAPTPEVIDGTASDTGPMLVMDEVHTYYGHIHALRGVSITVERGEIVTLIGANGAGKTTTLKTISGLLHPRKGTVTFEGRDISKTPAHALVRGGIGQSPEGRRIFARMTVNENLQMGAFIRDPKEIQPDIERVFNLFPRLRERIGQLGGTLSGGEQQMLAIGRALMLNPKLLIMDEPSEGLAPTVIEMLVETFRKLEQEGLRILLIEQNLGVATSLAERQLVMVGGEIATETTATTLTADPELQRRYLGVEPVQHGA